MFTFSSIQIIDTQPTHIMTHLLFIQLGTHKDLWVLHMGMVAHLQDLLTQYKHSDLPNLTFLDFWIWKRMIKYTQELNHFMQKKKKVDFLTPYYH